MANLVVRSIFWAAIPLVEFAPGQPLPACSGKPHRGKGLPLTWLVGWRALNPGSPGDSLLGVVWGTPAGRNRSVRCGASAWFKKTVTGTSRENYRAPRESTRSLVLRSPGMTKNGPRPLLAAMWLQIGHETIPRALAGSLSTVSGLLPWPVGWHNQWIRIYVFDRSGRVRGCTATR